VNEQEVQDKTHQAIAAMLDKHRAASDPAPQSTRQAPIRVGVMPGNESSSRSPELKQSDALQISEFSTDANGEFDLLIDLSDDTNPGKISAVKEALKAPGKPVLLVHSETKSAAHLAPDSAQCLNANTGSWAEHQLLEIVILPTTLSPFSERALEFSAHAFDATLITHGDARGLVWRVQCSYLVEAMALLGEAADPEKIEDHARQAGMRCTPLLALDQISLKLMDHVLHDELHRLSHMSIAIVMTMMAATGIPMMFPAN